MVVTADQVIGTIGGGHLELKAVELAREWLSLGKAGATQRHYPLGPALGQCCGGAVDLLFRPVTEVERPWVRALAQAEREGGDVTLVTDTGRDAGHTSLGDPESISAVVTRHRFRPWQVWVFGAGHVGKALVQVLATLPTCITWVDSRDAEFPAHLPHNASMLLSDYPADEVAEIPAGADVLVLTHSHALDLEIVTRLLRRNDLAYTGVIGSETKASLFRRRLAERGVDASGMVCPIGAAVPGHRNRQSDKHPGASAISVAADLLARRTALSRPPPRPVASA
jgi:xanthine dehydrogenase accessory factor